MAEMTRRTFLGAVAAVGAGSCIPSVPALAAPQHKLIVGRRTIEVLGKPAEVFGVTGGVGRSGLLLEPGERFSVALENTLGEETTVHWHGLTPTPELDGISETGYVPPLAPGEIRNFDFVARPGTHWMHSHHALQEQSLLTAPLIVREANASDLQEVTLLLNDFSFRDPAEILEGLTGQKGMDHGGMAGMDNGDAGGMAAMDHSTIGGMDLNDVEYDAFLANDRTLDDPEVIRTERNGRVRLRIINGAASTAFWIDLDGRQATVLAADGNPVKPLTGSRFPLAQAQRLDLLIEVPAGSVVPVFARREGDVARTGIVLAAPGASIEKYAGASDLVEIPVDLSFEQQLVATAPLNSRPVDHNLMVMLGGAIAPYVWTLNDKTWQERQKLEVKSGQRVALGFMNHSMMAHPMHLHGHQFQVTQINKTRVAGAMRDTVLIPPMGTVTVEFDADNPGRWLYHCHNLYHMMTGMMSELVYI
ncbi:multicopper oxidase family protein [Devosia sp. CN2-171]|uniref:multicopper oxidase family protein n=1 Tax=Devosia sp. CN2-171 TaxID=3400909 RepID=UPI003BF7C941